LSPRPRGRRLSLIDVPGHERFVRTMVAGATGMDLFLLVIDAAEGARPQTLEHLAILRLLGVEAGVVAVTKADLVDEETLEIALEEARELVPGAEVVAVSAKTGAGLDELGAALARVADVVPARAADGPARLYIDRVFTLRGIGTVATGTLWSGTIAGGDTLGVAPRGGEVRVRTVQVHDTAFAAVREICAFDFAALFNLNFRVLNFASDLASGANDQALLRNDGVVKLTTNINHLCGNSASDLAGWADQHLFCS
jgi:selenocysteine-specific elongation factor